MSDTVIHLHVWQAWSFYHKLPRTSIDEPAIWEIDPAFQAWLDEHRVPNNRFNIFPETRTSWWTPGYRMFFDKPADAVLFKLTWLGA